MRRAPAQFSTGHCQAALVERDLPFYDPSMAEPAIVALQRFAQSLGLLTTAVP
jgi:hypothetical protein